MQDVAKQSFLQNTALMDSRVKLETWRTGIKQRALEHKLIEEQAIYSPALTLSLTQTLTLTLTIHQTLTLTLLLTLYLNLTLTLTLTLLLTLTQTQTQT